MTEPRVLVAFDLDGFKQYNDRFGHPAGDALLARLGRSLSAAVEPHGSAYRLGGDEFCALVSPGALGVGAIAASARAALREQGQGFTVTASLGVVVLPIEAQSPRRALQIADERLYRDKSDGRSSGPGEAAHQALAEALDVRTGDGFGEVAMLARATGRALGLAGSGLEVLMRAAELRDLGTVAVPEAILAKQGALDQDELGFVEQHSLVAERLLSTAPALAPVGRLVRASGESWDGSGYPDGLAGEQIPLGARIVATCESFHTLTEVEGLSSEEAVTALRKDAGRRLDPAVVEVIASLVGHPSIHDLARAGERGEKPMRTS
jgi:diguanylate cyclase (GGDEF)-like protein